MHFVHSTSVVLFFTLMLSAPHGQPTLPSCPGLESTHLSPTTFVPMAGLLGFCVFFISFIYFDFISEIRSGALSQEDKLRAAVWLVDSGYQIHHCRQNMASSTLKK